MDENEEYPVTQKVLSVPPNLTLYKGKVIFFTAFYQQQAHSRYTQSLVSTISVLDRLGIRWDFIPSNGDFHVERAINNALAAFIADKDATDFFNIDSDESWDVMAVLRLLSHQEEVVCGAYRMKNRWETYTCTLKGEDGVPHGKILKDGTALLLGDRIPAGFLRIKRSAVQKFADNCGEDWYWSGKPNESLKVPMFFHTSVRNHQFFSQDYEFSERLKALGIDLWVDPNMDISHFGMTEYPGNLDKYLRNAIPAAEQEEKDQAAFAAVQKMAAEIEAKRAA